MKTKQVLRALATLALLGVVSAAVAAGCSSSGEKASPTTLPGSGSSAGGGGGGAGGGSATVDIKNFAFSPSNLTVKVGTKVTFTNHDDAPHTATAKDGSFDTGNLDKGDSKTITFSQAGTISYICSIHNFMKGTIHVTS